MIIAIDGPAGAGKSTVCKMLAKRLGLAYLDTGAMYRAVAWALESAPENRGASQTDLEDPLAGQLLERLGLRFVIEKDRLEIYWGQKHLREQLRGPQVTEAASRLSRLPAVRQFLVARQRELARQGRGVVAEGRDTATVVFPEAELKVFLTAALKTRAKRRYEEYRAQGVALALEKVEALLAQRDDADSMRDHSPMRQAENAFLLDTSGLCVEEVVERLAEKARNLSIALVDGS
ncbi:MAG: (d)CMP kinase [Syntrophobacteraceae bacterium]